MGSGGGLFNTTGSVFVVSCTFANCGASGGTNGASGGSGASNGAMGGSFGGGVANTNGTLMLRDTIFSTNNPGTNIYGNKITDAGYNLSSDDSAALTISTKNTNPEIITLTNNGGPTMTMALLSGSPAIAKGDSVTYVRYDQRELPRAANKACCIGAYEFESMPFIVTQPLVQTQANGGTVTFTVAAVGNQPLTYLWQFNGSNILNAPNLTNYTIPNVTTNIAWTNANINYPSNYYTVVVTNGYSHGYSSAATSAPVYVLLPPFVVSPPTNQDVWVSPAGTSTNSTSFYVTAAGSQPFFYQWQTNGINLADGGNIFGSMSNCLTISNVSSNNVLSYSVIISNFFGTSVQSPFIGSVTSAPASLNTYWITTQPASQTVPPGGFVTFSVSVGSSLITAPTLTYQWFCNTNGTWQTCGTGSSYIASVAGNYFVQITTPNGSQTNSAIASILVGPSITTQPVSQTNFIGGNVTFSVTASGIPAPAYQWYFGPNPVSGETSTNYTINNVQTSNAGNYTVVVTNLYGSVTSSVAALTVLAPAPSITAPPTNQTVALGSAAAFYVAATGYPPLFYQWRLNGTNILAATNTTYSIPGAQPSNIGTYTVLVTNAFGSITSAPPASLNMFPFITVQPTNQTIQQGGATAFSVAATGSLPLQYQWQLNGTNILSATNTTYQILNAQPANAGTYTAWVTNAFGSVTSSPPAVLTVNSAPIITSGPSNHIVTVGGSVTFSVTATGTAPLNYEWYFNNNQLSYVTSASWTLNNVQTNDAGNYYVIVANSFGFCPSATVTLAVLPVTPSIARPQLVSNNFSFVFQTQTGLNYIIQDTTNLAVPNWIPLVTNAGTGGLLTNQVAVTNAPSQYFRFQVE
jgi:hypothetical protein